MRLQCWLLFWVTESFVKGMYSTTAWFPNRTVAAEATLLAWIAVHYVICRSTLVYSFLAPYNANLRWGKERECNEWPCKSKILLKNLLKYFIQFGGWDALSCTVNYRRVISCVACSEACLWSGPPSQEQANTDASISQTPIRPENNIRQAFVCTTFTLKEIINPPHTQSGISRAVCLL